MRYPNLNLWLAGTLALTIIAVPLIDLIYVLWVKTVLIAKAKLNENEIPIHKVLYQAFLWARMVMPLIVGALLGLMWWMRGRLIPVAIKAEQLGGYRNGHKLMFTGSVIYLLLVQAPFWVVALQPSGDIRFIYGLFASGINFLLSLVSLILLGAGIFMVWRARDKAVTTESTDLIGTQRIEKNNI